MAKARAKALAKAVTTKQRTGSKLKSAKARVAAARQQLAQASKEFRAALRDRQRRGDTKLIQALKANVAKAETAVDQAQQAVAAVQTKQAQAKLAVRFQQTAPAKIAAQQVLQKAAARVVAAKTQLLLARTPAESKKAKQTLTVASKAARAAARAAGQASARQNAAEELAMAQVRAYLSKQLTAEGFPWMPKIYNPTKLTDYELIALTNWEKRVCWQMPLLCSRVCSPLM